MQATINGWFPRELECKASAFRTPRRITITIPNGVYEELIRRSNQEGRSLSNLAAFLIEKTLDDSHHA
ncbi:MAG: ribbon-helix-helix domain-containing protein [Synechococcaceae cyanobacterium]|jgi:hypothetical protein